LELLGGLDRFINRQARVFVKINHLSSSAPAEKAINTHPEFLRKMLELLVDQGARITVGDDIAGGRDDGFLATGIRQICDRLGVRLVNLKETGFVETVIRGAVLEKVFIARPVLEAETWLNLPKLKTHSFTVFTGAVKNLFGLIPLGLRLHLHRRFFRNDIFSQMLVDLFSAVPPRLTVMDAVVGMEGEGPSAGRPKAVGLIVASADAVAVDAVASRVVGYDPAEVFTTAFAEARGLGAGDLGRIEIVGERIQDVEVRDFRPSAAAVNLFRNRLPSVLYARIQEELLLTPAVVLQRCTGCGQCIRICPTGAAQSNGKKAWIVEEKCIHCLCCHESCPGQAIRLKQRPVGRLINAGRDIFRKLNLRWRRL